MLYTDLFHSLNGDKKLTLLPTRRRGGGGEEEGGVLRPKFTNSWESFKNRLVLLNFLLFFKND